MQRENHQRSYKKYWFDPLKKYSPRDRIPVSLWGGGGGGGGGI
jgi:hypothetical protein